VCVCVCVCEYESVSEYESVYVGVCELSGPLCGTTNISHRLVRDTYPRVNIARAEMSRNMSSGVQQSRIVSNEKPLSQPGTAVSKITFLNGLTCQLGFPVILHKAILLLLVTLICVSRYYDCVCIMYKYLPWGCVFQCHWWRSQQEHAAEFWGHVPPAVRAGGHHTGGGGRSAGQTVDGHHVLAGQWSTHGQCSLVNCDKSCLIYSWNFMAFEVRSSMNF